MACLQHVNKSETLERYGPENDKAFTVQAISSKKPQSNSSKVR